MSERTCVVLLGSTSVIGGAIANSLQEFFGCQILKVSRIRNSHEEDLRILVSGNNASQEIALRRLESFPTLRAYLKHNDLVIKALIVSIGYMSESNSQLEYRELLKTFDANVAYPVNAVMELASELSPASQLIFLSSSLNGLPLQRKHFNYQLSKEYSDSLLLEFLRIAKNPFRTFLVRPGHVATKLNKHIPTRFSSIEAESIGESVLRKIRRRQIGSKRIEYIYVPSFLRSLVLASKTVPKFFLKLLFKSL